MYNSKWLILIYRPCTHKTTVVQYHCSVLRVPTFHTGKYPCFFYLLEFQPTSSIIFIPGNVFYLLEYVIRLSEKLRFVKKWLRDSLPRNFIKASLSSLKNLISLNLYKITQPNITKLLFVITYFAVPFFKNFFPIVDLKKKSVGV